MFKFKNPFKQEVKVQNVEVATLAYPDEVQQIHRAFETAGEKLLMEAQETLKALSDKDCNKGQRLANLGFVQSREALIANKIIEDQQSARKIYEMVSTYKVRYPNRQFITEVQVKEICKKCGLIMGNVSFYKGFVPEKNLKDIESFNVSDADTLKIKKSMSTYSSNKGEIFNDGGENAARYTNIFKLITESMPLQICAPKKDMDIPNNYSLNDYKATENIHIPDPVVLQPVNGGYLVITAWGDEASDPNININNN